MLFKNKKNSKKNIKKYDVIVIGSGSGGEIVDASLRHGLKTAWVDKGPLGGTCLNVGCIPSKMLIYPADRIIEIQESKKLGIQAEIKNIDFEKIMEHMKKPIKQSHEHMKKGLKTPIENFDYYKATARFTDDYTIEIKNKTITGEKIFIGTGARPLIPPIKGINDIEYLTNETVFNLTKKPESMIIIGGGIIAVEFAHFFSAMGTKITILQRGNRIVKNLEPEISKVLQKQMQKRINIITNTEVTEVKQKTKNNIEVTAKTNDNTKNYTAEKILIATGRKSNADLLQVEKTGVELDQRGYIKVDEYMKTNKKNIWAFGDATGKYMFKHVANEEAIIAFQNAISEHKHPMKYDAVPYAVFTYPQIAAVGLTEQEAKKTHEILVGHTNYKDVIKGEAMEEQTGFTKAIVDKKTKKILGFHIIGPYAPILIQEVINAIALGGQIGFLGQGMHIHPALTELVLRSFSNLKETK